ncbi:MAG: glucosaminidase domain-containing protein [Anaerostipes sp.]|jgi:hypothetical protein
MTKQQFIEAIAGLVKKYAYVYGITVHSPIIAQAILESGWGESKLAATYHNYFGLKCGTKWKGKSVNISTQEEYTAGTLTTITDNFRVYDSMEEGVKGYFEFIQLARYQNLRGITSPKKYLETIKADGYATSSTYVQNTMKLVEQYSLTKYDEKEVVTMARSRQAVVDLVTSWHGKNEADGSYKAIIDIYNSYGGSFPRGTKMTYGWAWCACTWSAIAIKLGYTDIMPIEISCYYIIERAKEMGIWQENDGYTPKPGDAVLYDWDDNGNGDCSGTPEHIGTVISVSGGKFVVEEGNMNNRVGTRTMAVNGRYIRGFITPRYTDNAVVSPSTPTLSGSIDELAKRVIAGEFGSGDARKTALGDKYAAVQARVNELLNGAAPTPSKSVTAVAKEVIAGKWGNGSDRKAALENAGYNYSEVQAKVNELCGGSSVDYTAVAKQVIAGKWGNGEDRKNKLKAAGYDYSKVQAKVNELLS